MAIRAGSDLSAVDFALPDHVDCYGNGTNTVTATTWTDLPTTACTGSITNPHPAVNMICLVTFGAWIIAGSSIATRICPRVSGSTTIAAGVGAGGPMGWGQIPISTSTGTQHVSASAVYSLPPGAATFTMQAYRDSASGTQNVNYPTIQIVPIRFDA